MITDRKDCYFWISQPAGLSKRVIEQLQKSTEKTVSEEQLAQLGLKHIPSKVVFVERDHWDANKLFNEFQLDLAPEFFPDFLSSEPCDLNTYSISNGDMMDLTRICRLMMEAGFAYDEGFWDYVNLSVENPSPPMVPHQYRNKFENKVSQAIYNALTTRTRHAFQYLLVTTTMANMDIDDIHEAMDEVFGDRESWNDSDAVYNESDKKIQTMKSGKMSFEEFTRRMIEQQEEAQK